MESISKEMNNDHDLHLYDKFAFARPNVGLASLLGAITKS